MVYGMSSAEANLDRSCATKSYWGYMVFPMAYTNDLKQNGVEL